MLLDLRKFCRQLSERGFNALISSGNLCYCLRQCIGIQCWELGTAFVCNRGKRLQRAAQISCLSLRFCQCCDGSLKLRGKFCVTGSICLSKLCVESVNRSLKLSTCICGSGAYRFNLCISFTNLCVDISDNGSAAAFECGNCLIDFL